MDPGSGQWVGSDSLTGEGGFNFNFENLTWRKNDDTRPQLLTIWEKPFFFRGIGPPGSCPGNHTGCVTSCVPDEVNGHCVIKNIALLKDLWTATAQGAGSVNGAGPLVDRRNAQNIHCEAAF